MATRAPFCRAASLIRIAAQSNYPRSSSCKPGFIARTCKLRRVVTPSPGSPSIVMAGAGPNIESDESSLVDPEVRGGREEFVGTVDGRVMDEDLCISRRPWKKSNCSSCEDEGRALGSGRRHALTTATMLGSTFGSLQMGQTGH